MQTGEKKFTGKLQGAVLFTPLLFLALGFTWIAMSPCLDNGFTNWDEVECIISNPKIKTVSLESVKTIFTTMDLRMYAPLASLNYALEYHFSGLDPRVYHATSLLLHLANTALVMLLARLLLNSVWAAFAIAVLFGVHPAHVEPVAWAAQRKELLCAFFYLSSLTVYASRPGGAANYFISLVLFICALLSKATAVTLPAALLLIDFLKREKIRPRLLLNKLPFLAFSAVFAFIQISQPGNTFSLHWVKRLLLPFYNLGFYFYTLLWPFNLSALYISAPGGRPVIYSFAAAALAGIFLLWKYFRRDREIVFGAAFFAVLLLPVLQFFPFGQALSADRYTYLSSIGVFTALAALARGLLRRLRPGSPYKAMLAACAAAAVLLLTATARLRCAVWKDGISLWTDTLRGQPRAGLALLNLCDAYLSANRTAQAEACVSEAILRYPGDDNHRYNLCRLLEQKKDFPKAEECFAQILKISPCHAASLNYLGDICLLKGQPVKAADYYARAIKCDGGFAAAYLALGKLALERNDKPAAVRYYEKALSSEPADKHTRELLGSLR